MSRPRSQPPHDRSAPGDAASKDAAPWYADGLRFECTQCGACCSGEPGYVFVDDAEISAMAVELDMTVEGFRKKYTRRVGKQVSLVEYPDGDCIFLDPDSRHCLVYRARPIQCRTWPFWDSTLETPADWDETRQVCPGAGIGPVYSLEQIEVRRQEKSV